MAIQTVYKGIRYRSRLEARWAAFFTRIGWQFTYEPFDGDGYIPDFLIHGDDPFLVEVKPAVTPGDYEAAVPKTLRGVDHQWEKRILIVGVSPFVGVSHEFGDGEWVRAGLLIERRPPDVERGHHDYTLDGDAAVWATSCYNGYRVYGPHPHHGNPTHAVAGATRCEGVSVFHELMGFDASPCGHSSGGRAPGCNVVAGLRRHWAAATNDVQWKKKKKRGRA